MPTATAKIGDLTLAIADNWETVEGNIYFPPSAIQDQTVFLNSTTKTFCPWKGEAEYYSVKVGDMTIADAAWYYADPYAKAVHIKNHIAFYKTKVEVDVHE